LISCSIGAATVSDTVCAVAPGYCVVTICTVGVHHFADHSNAAGRRDISRTIEARIARMVTTQYPGATAQTVSDTVAAPIEQEINGVEDMLYLYSQATSNGNLTITVTFKLGTDLDKAQVLVQNRVAIAQPRLPEEVQRNGVVTRKNSPDILMVVSCCRRTTALTSSISAIMRCSRCATICFASMASATSRCSAPAIIRCGCGSIRTGSRRLA